MRSWSQNCVGSSHFPVFQFFFFSGYTSLLKKHDLIKHKSKKLKPKPNFFLLTASVHYVYNIWGKLKNTDPYLKWWTQDHQPPEPHNMGDKILKIPWVSRARSSCSSCGSGLTCNIQFFFKILNLVHRHFAAVVAGGHGR